MYIERKCVDYQCRFCVFLLTLLILIAFFDAKNQIFELKQNNTVQVQK